MDDLQKMIDSYRASMGSMTERQLAEAERAIWDAYGKIGGRPVNRGNKRDWFGKTFGKNGQAYDQRSLLVNAGPWADPLWDMLDKGTPRATVVRIFRRARALAVDSRIPHDKAVVKAVAEYEGSGTIAHTSEGKAYRRGPGRPKKQVKPDRGDETQNSRSKKFLIKAHEIAEGYARVSLSECAGTDQLEVEKAVEDFTSYMREACEELRRRISSFRSDGRKEGKRQKVTRPQLRRACEVLGVHIPYGSRPDLDGIRRIHRTRAAQLHPDKNGGSDHAKDEYRAVIESYQVIVQYSEGLTNNGDRSHEAR